MRLLIPLVILLVFSLFILNSWVVFGQTNLVNPTQQNKLHVSFENNIAPSYEVYLEPDEKFILSQSYSLLRDENSRYNLVSYSIDDKDFVPISRLPRGDFTLDIPTDSSHSIVFLAMIQYPITVEGADEFSLLPESPTNDYWFDSESEVTVTILKMIEIDDKTRKLISGWSLDKSDQKQIPDDDSDFFLTPTIHMSDLHTVDFFSITQYRLDVVSQYGETKGSGWYDAGSTAKVSVIPPEGMIRYELVGWDGTDVRSNGNFAEVIVNSPTIIEAKWKQDYLPLSLFIIIPIAGVTAFFAIRRKTSKIPQKKTQQIVSTADKRVLDNYYKEIKQYQNQKSLDKLDLLLDSKEMTKARHSRIKEKLKQR